MCSICPQFIPLMQFQRLGMTGRGNSLPEQIFAATCILVRGGDWTESVKEKVLIKTRSLMYSIAAPCNQWYRTVSSWLETGFLAVTSDSCAKMCFESRCADISFKIWSLSNGTVDAKGPQGTVASRTSIIWKLVDGFILDSWTHVSSSACTCTPKCLEQCRDFNYAKGIANYLKTIKKLYIKADKRFLLHHVLWKQLW